MASDGAAVEVAAQGKINKTAQQFLTFDFDEVDIHVREVFLELVPAEDPKTMLPLIQQYAMDKSGKTLTEKLSPSGREKLAKLLGGMVVHPLD